MAERLHLSENAPNSVLVIAPIAFDNIITPARESSHVLGGSGTFAALASSYFAPTRIVSIVGEDFDKTYLNCFINRDIDISGLQFARGKTFFWKGRYYEDFNKRETLQIQLNVFEKFEPNISPEFSKMSYVFLGNMDPGLQLKSLKSLSGKPFIVANTIDFWIIKKRDELIKVLRLINILVIKDTEACILAQEESVIRSGHKLREMGIETIIIKKGEQGALLFHQNGIFSMPSYPVDGLKDPTGGDDAFAGALLGYLAAVGQTDFFNLKHAIVYATVIASLTVEDFSCAGIESADCKVIQGRYETLITMMTF